jgi:hypothetical protein
VIDSEQAKYLLVPQSMTNQQLVQAMPLFSGK